MQLCVGHTFFMNKNEKFLLIRLSLVANHDLKKKRRPPVLGKAHGKYQRIRFLKYPARDYLYSDAKRPSQKIEPPLWPRKCAAFSLAEI